MPSIILRDRAGKTRVVHGKPFLYEDLLEQTIAEVPSLLPLEIISDEAANFVTLGRQWAAGAGFANVVLLGSDGVLCVVETKLKRNPESRREVIAQVIEYAAYFSELTIYDIANRTEQYYKNLVNQETKSFDDLLRQLLDDNEDSLSSFKASIEQNLRDAKLRLIVAVDEVGEQAQKIVTFLNANSSFDIYLLQITAFKDDAGEVFVPSLYGYARKNSSRAPSKTWTWELLESDYGWTHDQSIEIQEQTKRLLDLTAEWKSEARLHAGWVGIRCLGQEGFGVSYNKSNGVELYFGLDYELPIELPVSIHVRRTKANRYMSGDLTGLSDQLLLAYVRACLVHHGIDDGVLSGVNS